MADKKCKRCQELENTIDAIRATHDAIFARTIKRDADIINGLLREVEALHYLLDKQRNDGGNQGESGNGYIYDCQNMNI